MLMHPHKLHATSNRFSFYCAANNSLSIKYEHHCCLETSWFLRLLLYDYYYLHISLLVLALLPLKRCETTPNTSKVGNKKNTHSVYEISQDFFFQLSSRSLCEQKEKGERKTRRQFSVFRRFVKCDTIFFEIKYLIANTNTEHIILLLRTGLG